MLKRVLQFFYWQPLFSQYLEKVPKHLFLCNTMPSISGSPKISIGEYCTVNGGISICARTQELPCSLKLGERVFIGHGVKLYIGNEIQIGDHCLIAQGCILRGYYGHPIDPNSRKLGMPDENDAIGAIVLEPNVWLGENVTINKGVRIGENSIIASGSVVTKDIPANVLAGGMPAQIIHTLNTSQ